MTTDRIDQMHEEFTVEAWQRFATSEQSNLTSAILEASRSSNDKLPLDHATDVYLPLIDFILLNFQRVQDLKSARSTFLNRADTATPFIIGLAGSVAVGKSTTARLLQQLLSKTAAGLQVSLVTTDGFLWPNKKLEEMDLMARKGFPESYDRSSFLKFVAAVNSGARNVECAVYSHTTYDILEDERLVVDQPDILIIEGLNVLQTGRTGPGDESVFVSDYFDLSLFVDAKDELIEQWYIERFLALQESAFTDPEAYFHKFANISRDNAIAIAKTFWRDINLKNLYDHIRPSSARSDIILHKTDDHYIENVAISKRLM